MKSNHAKPGKFRLLPLILIALALSTICSVPAGAEERISLRAGALVRKKDTKVEVDLPGLLGRSLAGNAGFAIKSWPRDNDAALQLELRDGMLKMQTTRKGIFPGHDQVDIPLGSRVILQVRGWGTLAQAPNLDVFNDPSEANKLQASFIAGTAAALVPKGKRLLGLGLITARFTPGFADDSPLKDMNKRTGFLRYACVEYIDQSEADKVKSVAALAGLPVHAVNLVGLDFADGDKHAIMECRQVDDHIPQSLSAASTSVSLAGRSVVMKNAKTPGGAAMTSLQLPTGDINRLLDLGLPETLDGFLVRSAAGKYFSATIDSMQLGIPNTDIKLRFGSTRLRVFVGGANIITLETSLLNSGALFSIGGLGISGTKRVRIGLEGKTISINFLDSLGDVNPLGFKLVRPTVAIDTENKALLLSGSLEIPDSLRFLLGDSVDIRGKLSKSEQSLTVLKPVEWKLMHADDPTFNVSLDQIKLGRMDKKVFLLAMGHAELLKDLDPAAKFGLPIDGPKLTKGKTVKTLLYVQAGKPPVVRLEVGMEESLDLNVGPIHGGLRDTRLVITRTKADGWQVTVAGTTDLNIELGPLKLDAAATTTISSDGSLIVAIPEDNPTRMKLAGLASVTLRSGYIALQVKGKHKKFAIDATVALDIDKSLPMIGGRTMAGHMALSTDGTFLFEAVDLPSFDFQNITFAFTTLKLERKLVDGQLKIMASMGGKVKFHDDFVLPPLSGQELDGKVTLTQSLRLILEVTGGEKGFGVDFGDYRFMINRVALALGGRNLITATGEGGVKVRYPSSKWLLVGLPNYLKNKETGPSFDFGGAVDISPYDIFVRTRTDNNTIIPMDIPGIHKKNNGFTLALARLGVGFNWSARYPEFAIQGNLYLPDPEADSVKRVPGTDRRYDSYMGLTLFAYGAEPMALRFMVDPDEPPALKINNIIELAPYETGVSIWLPPIIPILTAWCSVEHGGLVKIGNPDGGSGFLFNFKGGHNVSVATPLMADMLVLYFEFFDKLHGRLRLGGFDSEIEMAFPRPQIDPGNMIMVGLKLYPIIRDMDVNKLKQELRKPGSPLHEMFPRFSISKCHIYLPRIMNDFFPRNFPRTRDGRPKLAMLEHLLIDSADGAAMSLDLATKLMRKVAESNLTKRIPEQIISMIPPNRRRGRMNVDIFKLLKGNLHYRIQAAETKYRYDRVRGLNDLRYIAGIAHACRVHGVTPYTPKLMQEVIDLEKKLKGLTAEYAKLASARNLLLVRVARAEQQGGTAVAADENKLNALEAAMRKKNAEIEKVHARQNTLVEIRAAAMGLRPIADPGAHVISLPGGEQVNVSADLTRLDPKKELNTVMQYLERRMSVARGKAKSARHLLSVLWRASVADGRRLRVRNNIAVFDGSGVQERYALKLRASEAFGFVSDRELRRGPFYEPGKRGWLPGTFPVQYFKRRSMTTWLPGYRRLEWLDCRLDGILKAGRGRGTLELVRRGSVRVRSMRSRRIFLNPWRSYWVHRQEWQCGGSLVTGGSRRRLREIRDQVMDAAGWKTGRTARLALSSFRLDTRLGHGSRVSIDQTGRVRASIAGILSMSTRLPVVDNKTREFFMTLRKLRLGEPTGSPDRVDRVFARAWKALFYMRDRRMRPRVNGTDIILSLSNGLTAKFSLARLRLRYPWRWYRGWRLRVEKITGVRVDAGNGHIYVRPRNHWPGSWQWYRAFAANWTNGNTGAPGLAGACHTKMRFRHMILQWRGLLRDHWLRREYMGGNAYTIRVQSPDGWAAYTDGKTLRIAGPGVAGERLALNSALDGILQTMGGTDQKDSGRKWLVRTRDRSGVASNLKEVLAIARLPKKGSKTRTLTWSRGRARYSINMQPDGTITGMHGLTPRSGASGSGQDIGSSQTVLTGASGNQYKLVVAGPAVAVNLIGRGGALTPVFVDTRTESVRLPGATRVPNGLIVGGNLSLSGPRGQIRGTTQFNGKIFDNGNFDIGGKADIRLRGLRLANGKFRCSRRHGLSVEGGLYQGLVKAYLRGRVTRRWFSLNGWSDFRIRGTGLRGRIYLDPRRITARGSIYVANRRIAHGRIYLTSNCGFVKTISFRKRSRLYFRKSVTVTWYTWHQDSWWRPRGHWEKHTRTKRVTVKLYYTVGAWARVELGLRHGKPYAKVRGKIYIDGTWPIGRRTIRFNSDSMRIRRNLGPVRVTVDLDRKRFSVEKR